MPDWILFAGCLLVLGAFVAIVAYFKTALFGLTALNVFLVASATLSNFFFGTLFGELPDSFSADHADVVSYAVTGLLAMAAGVYLGWRPLAQARRASDGAIPSLSVPTHINDQVGWLTFCVGMVAELAFTHVIDIPTLSTAVNCIASLNRIGLFILLVGALHTGRWNRFLIAVALFGALSITGSLESGHTFLRINAILPMVAIFFAFSGFSLIYSLPSVLVLFLLIPLSSAWLDSRDIIRSASLDPLLLSDQIATFFREFWSNLNFPTAESFLRLLNERVDMTLILAEQVRHQPLFEPYAYGETVYSGFFTLIPRFLWPDKPVVAGGSDFVARFSGIVRPADDPTSVGVPYPFELYANGGPILVVLGLGVIGFVCARLELNLLATPKSLGRFWALALTTAVLCDGGQRTDVVLPALVASALAAYALGQFIEKFFLSRDFLSAPTVRALGIQRPDGRSLQPGTGPFTPGPGRRP